MYNELFSWYNTNHDYTHTDRKVKKAQAKC